MVFILFFLLAAAIFHAPWLVLVAFVWLAEDFYSERRR